MCPLPSNKSLIPSVLKVNTNLKPSTQQIVNQQVLTDLTKEEKRPGIEQPNPGKVISAVVFPKRFTVLLANTTGAAISGKLFNNDDFVAKDAGIDATFDDGFNGKYIKKLMHSLDNGNGLMVFGMTISAFDADGNLSDTVLNALALRAQFYTGEDNDNLSFPIKFKGLARRSDTTKGVVTIKQQVQLNFLMQLAFYLGAHCSAEIVFYSEPIQD